MTHHRFAATLALLTLLVNVQAQGQVFDPGPSDSNLFDTVINLPADQASVSGSFGDTTGSNLTAQLNVQNGGTVDVDFESDSGSEVNISGGDISQIVANSGSEVNFGGGIVGQFIANSGSQLNVSDGLVDFIFSNGGSQVNISGGEVGTEFGVLFADPNSDVNISGGSINQIVASSDSEVNFFGTEFFLDGTQLSSLALNEAFTVADRGGATLSGTLLDGSTFSFLLSDPEPFSPLGNDFFDPNATLTVTLTAVPEPGSITLLLATGGGLLARRRRNCH